MKKTGTLPLGAAILAAWVLFGPACNTGENGGPKEADPTTAPATEADPTPARAYEFLRQSIMEGKLIALYDICSERSKKEKFASERFRSAVASNPGLQGLELTAEDVAKMDPRALVETYFRLLPEENRKELALAMANVKVLGFAKLGDGRRAIDIESDGVRSRLLWVLENGDWKMDGEEKQDESPVGR